VDISFIVVNWNTKDYLSKCLKSIYDNIGNINAEIILVDNGSTDGSDKLAIEQFQSIKLINNKNNLGFAKATNIGIVESKGRYICIINSDVVVLEGCIRRLLKYMENNRNIGIIGPKVLNPDMTLQFTCKEFPNLWNTFCRAVALDKLFPKSKVFGSFFMTYFNYNYIKKVDVLTGCFWMVRKRSIVDVGLLDERFFIYAEDKDWCKRFKDKNWDVIYFPEAKIIHFGGSSSSKAPERFYIEMYKANIKYWQKHYSCISNIFYKLITYCHHLARIIIIILGYPYFKTNDNSIMKLKNNIALIKYMSSHIR